MNTPCRLLRLLTLVSAFPVAASEYQSPYSVEFTFGEEELIGDIRRSTE